MADRGRGSSRGRGPRRGGRGGRGGRGRGGSTGPGGGGGQQPQTILDLARFKDKQVLVKMSGGRQAVGVLKGWDPLLNLVIDETVETVPLSNSESKTRKTGLVICRGTQVVMVCPMDGTEEIANPFISE